jgi:hypothetical protein
MGVPLQEILEQPQNSSYFWNYARLFTKQFSGAL